MLLTKVPVPAPSVVLEFAIVGPVLVFQHTPLAVMASPPSSVIVPPVTADDEVSELIVVVVSEAAAMGLDVNVTWLP